MLKDSKTHQSLLHTEGFECDWWQGEEYILISWWRCRMRGMQRLLKAKLIQLYPIPVEQHVSMNSSQGIVSTNSLSGMTNEDI
jgi:hypothetical protein